MKDDGDEDDGSGGAVFLVVSLSGVLLLLDASWIYQ